MVFIEVKSQYIKKVAQEVPRLSKFINYLFEANENYGNILSTDINVHSNLTQDVDQLIEILIGVNQDSFNNLCQEYQRRVPDENSSWINNNYLIHLLIVGSFKFERAIDWLKPVLDLRRAESDEARLVKDVLLAAVTHQANTRLSPFVLSFFWASNKNDYFLYHIAPAKKELTSLANFPNFSDEYLNLLLLHSFTAVLLSSSVVTPDINKLSLILNDPLKRSSSKSALFYPILQCLGS